MVIKADLEILTDLHVLSPLNKKTCIFFVYRLSVYMYVRMDDVCMHVRLTIN
jgi:hypothetical protein